VLLLTLPALCWSRSPPPPAGTWYTDRPDLNLASLARDGSAWTHVGTIPGWDSGSLGPAAQTKLSCVLPEQATASLVAFEFVAAREAASDERVHCPRCSKVVVSEHGSCGNCGEAVYQCRQCRNINYEDVKSFFCVECGFCRFANFSFKVEARKSPEYPELACEADNLAAVQRLGRVVKEEADASAGLDAARAPAWTALQEMAAARPGSGEAVAAASASLAWTSLGTGVLDALSPELVKIGSTLTSAKLITAYATMCSAKLEATKLRSRIAQYTGGTYQSSHAECFACAQVSVARQRTGLTLARALTAGRMQAVLGTSLALLSQLILGNGSCMDWADVHDVVAKLIVARDVYECVCGRGLADPSADIRNCARWTRCGCPRTRC
jgi:hypothetical protein